jgi:hypothetical protein
LRTALLIPLLALFAACSAPESWRSVEVDSSFGETWTAFGEIATTNGYRMDEDESDRGLRIFTSRWRASPAPFRKGARTRLHARFERPEDNADRWRIDFRVQRQTISDISGGFDPEEGDWDDGGQDAAREDVILGQLQIRFGQPLQVTPEYERMRR